MGSRPVDRSRGGRLTEIFQASRERAYRELIAQADRIRGKVAPGSGKALLEQIGRLEREFREERRRDYFRSPLRTEAAAALREARRTVRGERSRSAGSGG